MARLFHTRNRATEGSGRDSWLVDVEHHPLGSTQNRRNPKPADAEINGHWGGDVATLTVCLEALTEPQIEPILRHLCQGVRMWPSDSNRDEDGKSLATLQEIGALLRQGREAQGLSRDQLAESLKMGSEQLQALERGDLDKLPEPVFIKAMTRRVASKLNLDCDTLIQRLQTALPSSQTSTVPNALAGMAAAANSDQPLTVVIPWRSAATLVLIIGAITGGAVVLASQRRSLQPSPVSTEPAIEQPVLELSPPEPSPSRTISISSKEPSWLTIRDGQGDVVYEGTLADTRSLPANAELEIYAGRPDLVLVSLGDSTPKVLGPIDEVRWYKLSPEP